MKQAPTVLDGLSWSFPQIKIIEQAIRLSLNYGGINIFLSTIHSSATRFFPFVPGLQNQNELFRAYFGGRGCSGAVAPSNKNLRVEYPKKISTLRLVSKITLVHHQNLQNKKNLVMQNKKNLVIFSHYLILLSACAFFNSCGTCSRRVTGELDMI